MLEVPEEVGDQGERLKLGHVAPGRIAGEQAARDTDEGLGLLDVAELGEVLRVGLSLTLDEDLVRSFDVVQGWAVAVFAEPPPS